MHPISRRIVRNLPGGLRPEEIAQALNATLCGPEAPALDLKVMADRLRADPSDVGNIVREILVQSDNARHHACALLSASIRPVSPLTVVSLGTHCFTSSWLRRWQLRQWSGPFDWLFSSVPMIAHCIEDDFDAFLDRSHYVPNAPEQRRDGPLSNRVNHALYRQRFGVENVFNHHDVHLDPDHAYFVRCVERFRACLNTPELKIFVVARTQGEGPVADLLALRDALRDRCQRFLLVAFEVPPGAAGSRLSPELEIRLADEQLQVCTFMPVSTWEPLRFVDVIDEHVLVRYLLTQAKLLTS